MAIRCIKYELRFLRNLFFPMNETAHKNSSLIDSTICLNNVVLSAGFRSAFNYLGISEIPFDWWRLEIKPIPPDFFSSSSFTLIALFLVIKPNYDHTLNWELLTLSRNVRKRSINCLRQQFFYVKSRPDNPQDVRQEHCRTECAGTSTSKTKGLHHLWKGKIRFYRYNPKYCTLPVGRIYLSAPP